MSKIASALIVYNHKLLLHLRDNKHPDSNLRDKWGLIGGCVDNNEHPRTAVLREIKEESSLEPSTIHYVGKLIINKPGDKIEVYLFCTLLTKDEVKKLNLGNEGKAVKFFSPNKITKLALSPEVKKYYEKYQKDIDDFIEKGILLKIKSS